MQLISFDCDTDIVARIPWPWNYRVIKGAFVITQQSI